VSQKTRKRPTRKATKAGTCRRCGGAIQVGQTIAPSRTEFSHTSCARLHITNTATERSRFVVGSLVGKACDGCGFEILDGEAALTVMTVPWHRECRTRR